MNKKINILLAEDDLNFGSVLRDYLTVNGYHVTLCEDGVVALGKFENGNFDICITDVMMPYKDGYSLAEEIRQLNSTIPLIFLTAKTLKEDILKAYKIGADDYIIKPFDSELLLYKIQAVLKRNISSEPQNNYLIGEYNFSDVERTLERKGKKQKLSPKEALLLRLLCENKNQVVSRQIALKRIWGDDNYFNGRSMDVYVTRLRKCLSADPAINIENLHGTGFILKITL